MIMSTHGLIAVSSRFLPPRDAYPGRGFNPGIGKNVSIRDLLTEAISVYVSGWITQKTYALAVFNKSVKLIPLIKLREGFYV